MQLIQEKNSVSDIVRKLSQEVKDVIIEDMKTAPKNYSKLEGLAFKQGEFKVSFKDSFSFLNNIILRYLIYLVDDEKEIERLVRIQQISLNSSYDSRYNILSIVSYCVNDTLSLDFNESIMHELTHMYQYNMGMKKRVNLYDKITQYLTQNKDHDAYYIALALYYTFPHEQDVFAHQFFATQGKKMNFQPYKDFLEAKRIVEQNYKNKRMQNAIHSLGFTTKTYLKRIHFGLKRFNKKLDNVARVAFNEELNSHLTTEMKLKHTIRETLDRTRLSELYNNLIPITTEWFYNF